MPAAASSGMMTFVVIDIHKRRITMKKSLLVAVTALVALSVSATAFAATKTQSQSGTRTQIKSGTCVK